MPINLLTEQPLQDMTDATFIDENLFEAGPPMRLQRSLGLVRPGQLRVARRALFAVLIAWAPLAVLAETQNLLFSSQTARSFFSDFAVHARYLIAVPALIFAEAECIPRLGHIVRHFFNAGLVTGADTARYEAAVLSTRRLLNSTMGDVLTTIAAYAIAVALIFYVSPTEFPEWYRTGRGGSPNLSLAGWWHALVSLPLLLILFFGWVWRLALWARFLLLMSFLNLRLVPSHPDHAGGLKFITTSLRSFRLISFAMGAVVAGTMANRVVHHGLPLLGFRNFAIGQTIFILIFFAGPLTVFTRNLREAKRRGVFQYGALAGYLGTEFEGKWLKQGINEGQIEEGALQAPDFSATTDLYSVAANVYEMRDTPYGLTDLISPLAMGLLPFLPVALLAVPLQVIVDSLVKLLL